VINVTSQGEGFEMFRDALYIVGVVFFVVLIMLFLWFILFCVKKFFLAVMDHEKAAILPEYKHLAEAQKTANEKWDARWGMAYSFFMGLCMFLAGIALLSKKDVSGFGWLLFSVLPFWLFLRSLRK